jgi:1-acyl-sn-glycerol-3-phosphate acyltransferase
MNRSPLQKFLLRVLTWFIIAPFMAASTIFFGCISLLCSFWDKSGRQQHLCSRLWARTMCWCTLSPVKVVHPEKLRGHSTSVFACNHLSYMDIPVVFSRLPYQFRILARYDLFNYPFVGWYLRRSGQVSIDDTNLRSAVAGLLRGVATLKSGRSLMLFPDGTRAFDGEVRTFLPGAAWMAIRAQVPIVPLALVGTYELLPMHTYHLFPHPLMLIVGDPIPTTGLTTADADALTSRLHAAISEMYYRYHEAAHRTSSPQ